MLHYDTLSEVAKLSILELALLEFSMLFFFKKSIFYLRYCLADRNSLFSSCLLNISDKEKLVLMDTTIRGFFLCSKHIALVEII